MIHRVLKMLVDYLGCFVSFKRGTQENLIYTLLITVFTPNLEFYPYFEVIHGSKTFKLTEG